MTRDAIKRAVTRKRAKLTALATCAILATTAALAWAAPQPIVGQANNTFAAPTYELTGGTIATLSVAAGSPTHNVQSAVGPGSQFKSADIGPGGSGPVEGTQFLAAGSYAFVCTLHPGMASTLVVSGGAPQAKPTVTVTILSKSLQQVAKKGKLAVKAESGAPSVKVEVNLGARELGEVTGAPGTLQVPLKAGAKRSLAKKSSARVSATATVEFGDPVTASKKLK